MRDPKRLDKFYDEFKAIHQESFPDWRYLQLMINFFGWIYEKTKTDGFFLEEDKALELFREFAKEI